jgi:hypothetical protein
VIFHLSIDADDPARTAAALARLWDCEAYPFPPIGENSWMVIADDGRGSAIEVYPRGVVLEPGEGDGDVRGATAEPVARTALHFAVATPWSEAEVKAIAAAEGWRAVTHTRGGMFRVIEVWVENRLLVEVLTAEMQAEYLAAATPEAWRAALAAGRPQAA